MRSILNTVKKQKNVMKEEKEGVVEAVTDMDVEIEDIVEEGVCPNQFLLKSEEWWIVKKEENKLNNGIKNYLKKRKNKKIIKNKNQKSKTNNKS